MSNKETFINEKDQKINSIGYENKELKKHKLIKEQVDLKKVWEEKIKEEDNDSDYFKAKELERLLKKDRKEAVLKKNRNIIKFFTLLIIIIAIAVFYFIQKDYTKNSTIKTEDVSITFTNQGTAESFKVFPLSLKIDNKTEQDITKSNLTIYFPGGTLNEDSTSELSSKSFNRTILSNKHANYKINVSFLPSELNKKNINYEFKYNLNNKDEVYTKKWSQTLKVSETPIELKINYPEKVNSKLSNNITIEVISNSDKIIKDISVIADIKNTLHLNYSIPDATISNNIFYIEELRPGEIKKITLNGFVEGQDGENKKIKVRLVKNAPNNKTRVLSSFSSKDIDFKIQKRDIQFNLVAYKNKNGDVILNQGYRNEFSINLRNNLDKDISNVKVKAFLPDEFFNKYSVNPTSGFYDSNNDFILWDKNIHRYLNNIKPNKTANLVTRLASKEYNNFSGNIKNPETEIKIEISAEKNNNIYDKIFYSDTYTVKLNTIYNFREKYFKENGEVIKKDDYVPVVGIPKRYLIEWELKSSTNTIDSPLVEAFIPHYVRVISNNKELTYNSRDRMLTWNPKSIPAFSGYNKDYPAKKISFIIEYIPTVPHLKSLPYLINAKKITGVDSHTSIKYNFSVDALRIETNVIE